MLKREATYFTPDLLLDHNSLCISGKLWMENAAKYFDKIVLYTKNNQFDTFYVTINVEHLNSASIKQLLEYFKLLKSLLMFNQFNEVFVIWNVPQDDLELIELIQHMSDISDLKIDIRKYKV